VNFSKKTKLALEAVLDIAYNARPEPVQAKEITRRQGIPQRYLEQVMQHLVHAGILKGVRGPRGGYTLALERRRITVAYIVKVVRELDDEESDGNERSHLSSQILEPMWQQLSNEIMTQLEKVTIEDLCRRAEQNNVPSEAMPSDFAI